MKKLAIIILQYNNSQLTFDLLRSIYNFEPKAKEWDIYVVDNNSNEDDNFENIHQYFPNVIRQKNKINFGFAGGINSVIDKINAKYILLLNNDMVLLNNAISKTLYNAELTKADVITCKIIDENNKLQNTSNIKLNTMNIFLSLFGLMKIHEFIKKYTKHLIKVGYINGAFLMINFELYKNTGGLNESFFMYGEDIDLMLRLNKYNAIMYYSPEGVIKHLDGASAKKIWNNDSKYLLKIKNSIEAHKLNKNRFSFLILKYILALKEVLKYFRHKKNIYIKSAKLILLNKR
jgi:hypothetical protein